MGFLQSVDLFRTRTRVLFVSALLLSCALQAGEILHSNVTRDGAEYNLSITARVNAPLAVVYRSITDFNNLGAINPSIRESQVLVSPEAGHHRVRTVIQVCILVFCKRVEQVQDVVLVDSRTMIATMVPGAGDFRAGLARWELTEDGVATELHFTEVFEPDFWVPPLIGPWLIKRKLTHEVAETAMHIEAIAGEQ